MRLTGDIDTDADEIRRVSALTAPESGQSEQELASYLAVFADWLRPQHVVLFGKFATGTEPVLATVALALVPLDGPAVETAANNLDVVAGDLHAEFRERHPGADSRVIRLPIGPAVAGLVIGEFRLPPEVTGEPAEVIRPTCRAEFQIPLPGGRALAVLSVSADSADGWPDIADQAGRIARSLTIGRPG